MKSGDNLFLVCDFTPKMESHPKGFFIDLPKLELHAHLNGSLSSATLRDLYNLKRSDVCEAAWNEWEAVIEHGEKRTLEECFQIFGIAHSLTSTPQAVYKATCDVIKEFAEDGVLYLELRSTPRMVPEIMTKTEYIQAILEGIRDTNNESIIVKLLISLDRKQGKESALETLETVLSIWKEHANIIVGIDLSGDPSKGSFSDYLPLLEKARQEGLKIAVHCGEIKNEAEINEILDFKPDRLGHCTCIHPDYGGNSEIWNKLLKSRIPVEVCLTSNVKCGTVKDYKHHHFGHLRDAGHPLILATDDKGVFDTLLSEEYRLAADNFKLNEEQLWQLSISNIEYSFASKEEKQKLEEKFLLWVKCKVLK